MVEDKHSRARRAVIGEAAAPKLLDTRGSSRVAGQVAGARTTVLWEYRRSCRAGVVQAGGDNGIMISQRATKHYQIHEMKFLIDATDAPTNIVVEGIGHRQSGKFVNIAFAEKTSIHEARKMTQRISAAR